MYFSITRYDSCTIFKKSANCVRACVYVGRRGDVYVCMYNRSSIINDRQSTSY